MLNLDLTLEIPESAFTGALTGAIAAAIVATILAVVMGFMSDFLSLGFNGDLDYKKMVKPVCIYSLLGGIVGFVVGYNNWPAWSVFPVVIGAFILLIVVYGKYEKYRRHRVWR